MDSSGGDGGLLLEETMEAQKLTVLDRIDGFQYTKEKSDSFVIDMERFSHGINKDINTNQRITVSFCFFFLLSFFFSPFSFVDNFVCS
jgi:hypothetical protein